MIIEISPGVSLRFHGWMQPGHHFQTANLIGSDAFMVKGANHGAWPSVVANTAWFLSTVIILVRAGLALAVRNVLPDAPVLANVMGLCSTEKGANKRGLPIFPPRYLFRSPFLLQDEGVLACWPRHGCRPQSSMITGGCCHRGPVGAGETANRGRTVWDRRA